MAYFPDQYFDLAIVDPPYGMDANFGHLAKKYGQTKTANDAKPDSSYFQELFRVSKNQIIWGYNHLSDLLPKTKEFIFWYKHQGLPTYSDGELAWTSFKKSAKFFSYPYAGSTNQEEGRCHPMQKPIALYRWLLRTYAQPEDRILDTHVGSASSLIACIEQGHDFVGFEICPTYYDSACARVEAFLSQESLFTQKGGAIRGNGCISVQSG